MLLDGFEIDPFIAANFGTIKPKNQKNTEMEPFLEQLGTVRGNVRLFKGVFRVLSRQTCLSSY